MKTEVFLREEKRFKDKTGEYHFIEWNFKANGNYIYAAARFRSVL